MESRLSDSLAKLHQLNPSGIESHYLKENPMDISSAIAQINPQATYLLTDSNATSWNDILEWYGPGPKPTPEQLEAAWQIVLAERAEAKTVRDAVMETAKGAVGKGLGALTAGERNALLAVVLFRLGAVDRSGKIRPIREWAGRDVDAGNGT
jgi:hypothetical protein